MEGKVSRRTPKKKTFCEGIETKKEKSIERIGQKRGSQGRYSSNAGKDTRVGQRSGGAPVIETRNKKK